MISPVYLEVLIDVFLAIFVGIFLGFFESTPSKGPKVPKLLFDFFKLPPSNGPNMPRVLLVSPKPLDIYCAGILSGEFSLDTVSLSKIYGGGIPLSDTWQETRPEEISGSLSLDVL